MVRQAQNTSSPPLRYSRLTIFTRAHGPRRDVYRIDVYQQIRLRTATASLWNDALSRKPSTRCLVESTAYRRLGVTRCLARTSGVREIQPIKSFSTPTHRSRMSTAERGAREHVLKAPS